MNLLCPNCQKMLTVPEEFAGQLMKCPLCNGTFNVPGLPGAAAPPASSSPEPEVYSVRHDPVPPPAPPLSHFEPPPPPPSTATTPELPPPPSLAPRDYQHTLAASFSPRVLPWIAPACLLLVFVLQFFNWLGVYPGEVPAAWQNAWQAAFGLYSFDPDMKDPYLHFLDDPKYKPAASVLTIFYLLLFFPVLVVTIASIALPFVSIKLPPAVDKLMPWRWGIVAAANLILFLFLALQLLVGFSLENRYSEWVDKQTESKEPKKTEVQKMESAQRGIQLESLIHTFWFKTVVLLHLLAVVCAALMYWINQRGPQRPLPKWELRW
jgi:hypothetical protein